MPCAHLTRTCVNAHEPAILALVLDAPPPFTLTAVLAHPDPTHGEALALLVTTLNPRPYLAPAAVLCCLAISACARQGAKEGGGDDARGGRALSG